MACKCSDFNAGMLTEPITIERRTLTSDGAGGQTESWATLTTAFAHIKASSGGETFTSDRVEARTRWKVTMRYYSGLRDADRIVIRSKNHNIRFINNVEMRDSWLQIDVDGGVAT